MAKGTKFLSDLVIEELASTPSTPSAGQKRIYAKDDGKVYTLDSSGDEQPVGSGLAIVVIDDTDDALVLKAQEHYLADTSNAAFGVVMPTGSDGAKVRISDSGGQWVANNLTITPATGEKFRGLLADEDFALDINHSWVQFNWTGSEWIYDTPAIQDVIQKVGASVTDSAICVFDGTTGATIRESSALVGLNGQLNVHESAGGQHILSGSATSAQVAFGRKQTGAYGWGVFGADAVNALRVWSGGVASAYAIGASLLTLSHAGAIGIGPLVTQTSNGQAHVLNGWLNAGSTNLTDGDRDLVLNANAYLGLATIRDSNGATLGGVALRLRGRTSDTSEAFSIVVNKASDSSTTIATTVISGTQGGVLTLGPAATGTGGGHLLQGASSFTLKRNSPTAYSELAFKNESANFWSMQPDSSANAFRLYYFNGSYNTYLTVTNTGAATFAGTLTCGAITSSKASNDNKLLIATGDDSIVYTHYRANGANKWQVGYSGTSTGATGTAGSFYVYSDVEGVYGLGITPAGAATVGPSSGFAGLSHTINGGELVINHGTAVSQIRIGDDASFLRLAGSTSSTLGARIDLTGPTSSGSSAGRFYSDNVKVGSWEATGVWTLGVDNSNQYVNILAYTIPQLRFVSGVGTLYNWRITVNNVVSNAFEISRSVAVNGSSYENPYFILSPNGNLTISGYATLGGNFAFSVKKITGSLSAATSSKSLPHGLNLSRIKAVMGYVETGSGKATLGGLYSSTRMTRLSWDDTNVIIDAYSVSSVPFAAAALESSVNRALSVYVFYEAI